MKKRKRKKNKFLKYYIIFGFIIFLLLALAISKTNYGDIKRMYDYYINVYIKKSNDSKLAKPYLKSNIQKYDLHGIDVSRYQGNIRWDLIKHPDTTKKIDFVFIRSTYGTNKDLLFPVNWLGGSANNFTLGAYHYYWANTNSTEQAKNFIEAVDLKKGNLPPVLDIETLPQFQSRANWLKGIKNWLYLVEMHFGLKPIIYTGESFYMHHLEADPFFKNYPRLWIANYNNILQPDSNWHFWQYSDKVKMGGIKGTVDFNVFKNDSASFNELLKK